MTHAETAAATRDALARLWLPPQEVLDMVQSALALDCLSDDSRHWLRRIQLEQRRQQKASNGKGDRNGKDDFASRQTRRGQVCNR